MLLDGVDEGEPAPVHFGVDGELREQAQGLDGAKAGEPGGEHPVVPLPDTLKLLGRTALKNRDVEEHGLQVVVVGEAL